MLAIAAITISFVACDEDEATPEGPAITAPAVTDVQVEAGADVTFAITTPGGFSTYDVSATGGTAVKKSEPAAGATSGGIVVTYTADATAGAGTVTIVVTDNNERTDTETATVNKTAGTVEETVITVSENIMANTTWETGKTYVLASRIAVTDGVTLTIEPGVVVKGQAGTGTNATALIIARGARIMAEGTAQSPIIFTSVADEIEPGMVESPNLEPDVNGLWGGLIILGKAPISVSTNEQNFQIEGIPASDTNGSYGGSEGNDNSGVIRYVSIRHGGANIGEGNEINGLTLGGVGSETIVEYIEVVSNQDDGIEWFGGNVNVSNVVVWNSADDAIDTDQAWAGALDNFIVIAGDETDHAMEVDGPEGSLLQGHTIKNGTIKGNAAAELADFRSGARGTFRDIYFFGFPDPAVAGRGDLSLSNDAETTNTTDNFASGDLKFEGLESTLPVGVALNAVFKSGTDAHATAVASGSNTVGADKTKFAGWSWAEASGALANL